MIRAPHRANAVRPPPPTAPNGAMCKAWSPTLLPNLLGTISAPSPRTFVPPEPRSSSWLSQWICTSFYFEEQNDDHSREPLQVGLQFVEQWIPPVLPRADS